VLVSERIAASASMCARPASGCLRKPPNTSFGAFFPSAPLFLYLSTMPLPREFRLERFFAKHEFATTHLLCCSDVQPMSMRALLELADAETLLLWENLGLGCKLLYWQCVVVAG